MQGSSLAKTESRRFGNVLIPVDSAPGPEPALEAARRLAWALQCPEVTFTLLYVGKCGEMPALRIEEQPGWSWRKVTREGDVVDTILAVARESPPTSSS